MKLGIRGRLFLASMALLIAVGFPVGLYLEGALRSSLERRIRDEIERHARSARQAILLADPGEGIPEVDALADRMGAATQNRITVIDPAGKVLGDSSLDLPGVEAVENHAGRPEIREAIASGRGMSRRYSTTVNTYMQYVALKLDDRGTVVRASMPLSEIDERVQQLRALLVVAGLLALGAAAFMSALAAYYLSRTLRRLVGTAQLAVGGDRAQQVGSAEGDGSVGELTKELERNVAALAAERDRFETALEGMPDAVLALDDERRVTAMNRAAHELLDVDGPVEGRSLAEVTSIPELQGLAESASGAEIELELDAGGQRLVLASVTRQAATGGCVMVLRDVSEVRRLETMRRDFVANVSHELRTPVSIIRANAETLLGAAMQDPQQAERFLKAMLRNADRLGRLIGDLLDISRIEAGKYPLNPVALGLAQLVDRTTEALEPEARAKDIAISRDVDDELRVTADPKALEQVLTNLVQNAVKYTQPGGHVEVEAHEDAGDVRIEVRDDGPGIEEAQRARVFERFYRVDPGRSRDMGGTGLGLSIVKHLVEAQGGRVGVESRSPRGSIFWLTLPSAP